MTWNEHESFMYFIFVSPCTHVLYNFDHPVFCFELLLFV